MNFIGIDIGTSSICGVIYDSSTQKTASITRENNTYMDSLNSWEKIQNTNTIVDIVFDIIREFQNNYSEIKAIGMTGQMHGILYVNAQGDAISPLYTWQDGRGNLLYQNNQSYATYLKEATGYSAATGFGLVTHFYNQANGLVPENATKLCTIMDYAVMKLCDRTTPLTDYSNAASLGFFDKKRLAFDTAVLQKIGIALELLPEIKESASFSGYFEGIPVYSAIGDNQASFLGSVRDIEHTIHVTVGTSSQISIYSKKYVEVECLDTRPLPRGGYILVGASLCGGWSFAILKTFFNNVLKIFSGKELSDAELYEKMTSIVYQEHSENDLHVKTLFEGTRVNPDERGEITNLSSSNLTPENLILGFVKGISQVLYDYYALLPEEIRNNQTMLIGSGNAIKKNSLLSKAFEERFGYSMHPSAIQEEAAFGACLCGMVGANYLKHFTEFK